jgi:hypothetical protein
LNEDYKATRVRRVARTITSNNVSYAWSTRPALQPTSKSFNPDWQLERDNGHRVHTGAGAIAGMFFSPVVYFQLPRRAHWRAITTRSATFTLLD